jgi:hypothetical protein
MVFTVTENGVPFGALTWSGAWSWNGPGGRRCPVINNRVMNSARRPPYLARIGLPITAVHADELTRTWGIRATDNVEIVPIEPRFVPLHGGSHLPVGTKVAVNAVAAVAGKPVGRLPRSIGMFPPFTGTVVAATDGMAILRRPWG